MITDRNPTQRERNQLKRDLCEHLHGHGPLSYHEIMAAFPLLTDPHLSSIVRGGFIEIIEHEHGNRYAVTNDGRRIAGKPVDDIGLAASRTHVGAGVLSSRDLGVESHRAGSRDFLRIPSLSFGQLVPLGAAA